MPDGLMAGYLPELVVRATLLLAGALIVSLLLRHASAASRHTFWTVTTLALLLLPLLQAVLPRLSVSWLPSPSPASSIVSPVTEVAAAAAFVVVPAESGLSLTDPVATVNTPQSNSRTPFAMSIWLFGVFGGALSVSFGLLRARRLVLGASENRDARLASYLESAAAAVGVRRSVRLLLSSRIVTPMTGGALNPVVLLPVAATGWDDERLDAVLRHELIHVRRVDVLRQLASRCSVACYWFHPVAWYAARLASLAREQACDEAVLRLGTKPSRYARHLLDLAEPRAEATLLPAVVRLDHPHLEERVMAILRATPVPFSGRLTAFASTAVVAWTFGVASVTPGAAQVPAPPTPPNPPVPVAASFGPLVPAAPVPAVAQMASGTPLGREFRSAGMAPMAPPAQPLAPLSPAIAPVAPMAPQGAAWAGSADDCDFIDGSYRSSSNGNGKSPIRIISTTEGDINICAVVRGEFPDSSGFFPAGNLPAGVTMTLATSSARGTQRLEVIGGTSRNTHRWFVNGTERPYDSTAETWHRATMDVLQSLADKSRVRGQVAQLQGEIAQTRGKEAQLRGEIAAVRGRDAALAGEVASVMGRIAATEAAVAGRGTGRNGPAASRAGEVRQLREREVSARAARDAYGVQSRVAEVEDRLRGAGIADSIRAVERRIAELNAPRRIAEVDARIEPQVVRLQRAIEAIRD